MALGDAFLLRQGVRVTGTDASWDAPFSFNRKRFAETGDAAHLGGPQAGRDIGYCPWEASNCVAPALGSGRCCR